MNRTTAAHRFVERDGAGAVVQIESDEMRVQGRRTLGIQG